MRRPGSLPQAPVSRRLLLPVLLLAAAASVPAREAAAAGPGPADAVILIGAEGAGGASGPSVDVQAATEAWLAKVPADKRASSDAYFEGGYWLALWDFLYAAAVLLLLLSTGVSAWMRDRAERLVHVRFLQAGLYWTQLIVAWTVLQFPLSIYAGYVREHAYGLSTQTLQAWLGDFAKVLLVNVVLGALLYPVLYAVLRRVRAWWVWGSLVAVAFLLFVQILAPVFILPLFNTFTRLEDPAVKGPILSLAAEYRKLAPGPLEEIIFYDHPSGRSRIEMAMRYKAENQGPN